MLFARVFLVLGHLILLLLLPGCRATANEHSAATCTKVGQTCQLAPGLLGICTEAAPGACDGDPCYVCMGQH
jgi:hypothetical protein